MDIDNKTPKPITPMVHLHLHTFYSILDGAGSIDDYIALAKEYGHPAIAITDHGNMSGTFDFYKKCKESGIKPIIGVEAYLNDNLERKKSDSFEGNNTHQLILVKNEQGYINANKLMYKSFDEGYYYRGRITTDWLFENKEGLIVTTTCLASKWARLVEHGQEAKAEERIVEFKKQFGEDFYAEIQINEVDLQHKYNDFIIRMSNKHDIPLIVTGDVHYAHPGGGRLQDVLIAIQQHNPVGKAFSLDARHLHYTSADGIMELNKKFKFDYDDKLIQHCLDNTLLVADKCNFDFDVSTDKYPKYKATPEIVDYFKTTDNESIITGLAHKKLIKKLKEYHNENIMVVTKSMLKNYQERLDYELEVIKNKGMLDYFLVVWELIQFCKKNGIWTGPGRGSAAGSLLSWCLGITKIDPIRFGLYFERFLNPTRKGPPDIDIDFETGSDEDTTGFFLEKYGKESVFQVITFSTFNEKGCLKDVVRALGNDAGFQSDVFAVTKEMPNKPVWDVTLKEWFEKYPQSRGANKKVRDWLVSPENRETLDMTLKLQGEVRTLGKHAAGIVITPGPAWQYIPVNMVKGYLVSAFQESGSGKDLSELGLLKLDRLNLTTLNVIKNAIELIKEHKGEDVYSKVELVNLEDQNLYAELRRGENVGVFQFESEGINGLIKGIHVEKFDELVAANALHRPGPMGIDAHTEYIKNKKNPEYIRYVHPALEPLLKDTNGVLIFQEQLMFIAHTLGGMSLGDGDNLRKAMDEASTIITKSLDGTELTKKEKRKPQYIKYLKLWEMFLNGAKEKGLSEHEVKAIEEWLIKYLGYSFNKSHSVSYSYLAMQTLFLKTYYPTEFYCSLLNNHRGSSQKDAENQWIGSVAMAAMNRGIEILPPSRKSSWQWTIINKNTIQMGLSAINGIGEIAYNILIENNFSNLSKKEFFEIKWSKFNRTCFNAGLKAGIFDDWSESRDELSYVRDTLMKKKNKTIEEILEGQEFIKTSEERKDEEFKEVCRLNINLIKKISSVKNTFSERNDGYNIESVLSFEDDKRVYYFYLDSVKRVKGKAGIYYKLAVGDGARTVNINMWDSQYNKWAGTLEEGGFYATMFMKDSKWLNFDPRANLERIDIG